MSVSFESVSVRLKKVGVVLDTVSGEARLPAHEQPPSLSLSLSRKYCVWALGLTAQVPKGGFCALLEPTSNEVIESHVSFSRSRTSRGSRETPRLVYDGMCCVKRATETARVRLRALER